MSTRVSVWGEKGSIKVDRQECQVYLREPAEKGSGLDSGWTSLNTTQLLEPEWFYLRGEEYSRQIDQFVKRIQSRAIAGQNDFRSALETDRVVAMIHGTMSQPMASKLLNPGFFDRLKFLLRGGVR